MPITFNKYALLCGLLSSLLGLLVLFGWHIDNRAIVQIHSSFAPMQYNTALCFFLAGGGFIAMLFDKITVKIACGVLVFAVGFLTLIQYVFDVQIGLDQLFIDHTVMTKTSHPGRMAPNTALCFSLTGLFLVLKFRKNLGISLGIIITIIALSIISFVGYLLNQETIYGWGNLTRMAIHTALGFLVLGIGFTAYVMVNHRKGALWAVAPSSLTLVALLVTCFATYIVYETGTKRNQSYFSSLVLETQLSLKNLYNLYEQSLSGGLGLFYASNNVDRNEWKSYVAALDIKKNLSGINGVGFISYVPANDLEDYLKDIHETDTSDFKVHPPTSYDDKFIIKYIEPFEGNKSAVGLDIGFEQHRREAAERARDEGLVSLTKKIELVQDNEKSAGFLLLLPFYNLEKTPSTVEERRKHFVGWVYAPFIGKNFLRNLSDINQQQLDFSVYDGMDTDLDHLIYQTSNELNNTSDLFVSNTTIELAGRTWTITWSSTEKFQPPFRFSNVLAVLIVGLIFTSLLYTILQLLFLSRKKIAEEVEDKTKEIKSASIFRQSVMNNIPDMLFVKDKEFKIVMANEAFLMLYPKKMRADVIGTTTIENYDEKEREEFLKNDRIAFEKGHSEVEEMITFPNGDVKTLVTKKVRFKDAYGKEFILGLSRDITDRKLSEEELMRSNTELERFAYIASHDLQEPLRMVTNFTGLLNEEYEESMDDTAKQYMYFIVDASTRMQALIADLLEYSRIGSEDSGFSEFSVQSQLDIVLDNLDDLIDETNATIHVADMPIINANPVRFVRLLQNLIGNAIKYRAVDRQSIIHMKVEERGKEWIFCVEDNGIGIKEEYLDQVFVIFKRLHNKDEYGGTGIGLAICKKIVESFGGNIWVESTDGEGSQFYFTIPKRDNSQEEE